MNMAFPGLQGRFQGKNRPQTRQAQKTRGTAVRMLSVCAALLAGVPSGCIFSPTTLSGRAIPITETRDYDVVTQAPADVVVELFEPFHNPQAGAGSMTLLQLGTPVRVREPETGRVVEYRPSRRGYGTWDAARERELQLFLLRGFFLKPGVFDSDTGLGTLASLYERARLHDRYTRRIDSASAEEFRRATRTTVRPRVLGIQIRLNDTADTISLEVVAPGSPAYRAGMRRGMTLLAINDSSVTGDSAFARFVRFVEADTAATKLTFAGPQGVRTETVIRDTASFPTVQVDSVGGAGYIVVYSFTGQTVDGGSTHTEFRRALDATRRFPATVLDLRGNGGGSLTEVLRMADEVLASGVIIHLVERGLKGGASRRTETTYRARSGDRGERRRYVLLADSGSASASEIFISALRENLDVPMVGTRTYGKGMGQAGFDTPGGETVLITYGTALSASGTDYNSTGIPPTHPSDAKPVAMLREAAELAVPGALARRAADGNGRGDVLRTEVIDWNRRQALRPDVVEWSDRGGRVMRP